jgi:hypothetical protein
MFLIVGETENSGYLGSSSSLYFYSLNRGYYYVIFLRRRPYYIKPVSEMTIIWFCFPDKNWVVFFCGPFGAPYYVDIYLLLKSHYQF